MWRIPPELLAAGDAERSPASCWTAAGAPGLPRPARPSSTRSPSRKASTRCACATGA
jgi:hypothetical protein